MIGLSWSLVKLWVASFALLSDRSGIVTESLRWDAFASCSSMEGMARTGDIMSVSIRPVCSAVKGRDKRGY